MCTGDGVGEHAAWARAVGGPHAGGLAGPGTRPPGAFGAARGGTPAARSDAPGSRSCRLPSRHRALPRRMPRAPPGLSLLLMAALAFAATPPLIPDEKDDKLKLINPWLSACDLMQPASATDLKGACSDMWSPGPFCPPCPPSNNSTTQCLLNYLKESHKEEVCSEGVKPEDRRRRLRALRVRHCCEHAVDSALPAEALDDAATCTRMLDALLAVDALAARISCEFAEVLYRYDCGQKYSIKHQCDDCKVRSLHPPPPPWQGFS